MLEKKILDQLIDKGGLYANCAKIFYNDRDKSRMFIYELAEQCHVEYTSKIWGKSLIRDIKKYTKNKLNVNK